MSRLLGRSSSDKQKLLERKDQLLSVIDETVKILGNVHEEITAIMENISTEEAKAKESYRTKTELREAESKKAKKITRAFKASMQRVKWGQVLQQIQKCVSYWLEKMAPIFVKKQEKALVEEIKPIPFKLAAIMFFTGDYYKACNLLKTCLYLEPGNCTVRGLLLRWAVFLGEFQIVDARLEMEKKLSKKYIESGNPKERLNRIIKACEAFLEFYRKADNEKAMDEIISELKEAEDRKENTFAAVELEALLYFMKSHFAKTSGCSESTPDSLWCLQQRYQKCDSLLRNRLRGIHHDEQRVNITGVLEDPMACLEAMSTYAEYSDSVRDVLVEHFNLGFVRETFGFAEFGFKVAAKLGCYTRAVQMANLALLAVLECNTESAPISVDVAKNRLYILSTESRIEPPTGCYSPARQVLQKLQESFDELKTTDPVSLLKRLHDFKKGCVCELCQSYINNVEFAMDYHFTVLIYHGYNEVHLSQMHAKYSSLREQVNIEQCSLLANDKKGLKMKPPLWMCEIYSIGAIRWLRACELQGRDYLRDTKKAEFRTAIIEQVIKFHQYGRQRFLPYYIACAQIKRHDTVGDSSSFPYSWMKPSSENDVEPKITASSSNPAYEIEDVEKAVEEAVQDYKYYSHLLYRDWRFPLCTFIGRFTKDPWMAAMMWSESTVLTTRASSRLISGKIDQVVFSRANAFKNLVERLPRDFTAIQLATDENDNLFLIKLYCERSPIVLPLAHSSKIQRVRRSMNQVIKANEASAAVDKSTPTAVEFWSNRREVDGKLKSIVQGMQLYLFRSFVPFLLPSQSLAPRGKKIAKDLYDRISTEADLFDLNLAEELVGLCPHISKASVWNEMVLALGQYCQLSAEKTTSLQKEYPTLQRKLRERGVINREVCSYTFMAICPTLSLCPLEAMDIFAEKPHVGRIVSIHALFRQVMVTKSLPREVSVCNSYYVLDPDNNLVATQKRMTEFLAKFSMKGIVGGAPSSTELKTILQEKDILFYMGHGSGSKHLPKRTIKESKCNAVSVLMGCSSVHLDHDGWALDGKSTVYDYTIANCPAVVGCLWMVTDGEIDRFFMALVQLSFSSDANTTINDGQKRLRSLMEAMRKARTQSKLPYLTGAAVVNYGLPVISSE